MNLVQRRLHADTPVTAIGHVRGWIWAQPDGNAPPFSISQTDWLALPELDHAKIGPTLIVSTIRIDLESEAVTSIDGDHVSLTPAQFRLVAELAKAQGAICSRDALSRSVLYRPWRYDDRSIDQLVTCARGKLPPGRDGRSLLQSVRTQGYRLRGVGQHG